MLTLSENGLPPATVAAALSDPTVEFRLLRHHTQPQAILRTDLELAPAEGVEVLSAPQAQGFYDAGGYEEIAGGVV